MYIEAAYSLLNMFTSVYFIFDPLKPSYESFDFCMEWIQDGTIFFPECLSYLIKHIYLNK